MSLWSKYFVVVLAAPLALFILYDRAARKVLATPGPYIAVAVALAMMAPHIVWLVQNDFLPFTYAEHRALPSRGLIDHIWHPVQFGVGQAFFLIPSALIALPLFFPRRRPNELALGADAFDRRIVDWLAFGPFATVVALSAISGRGTVAMWGYPLWLFLGLWIVLHARALDRVTFKRIVSVWAVVFACFAIVFVAAYDLRARFHFHERYIAVLYPGDRLGQEMSRRYRAMTGKSLAYVIGAMWEGGNIGHYAPERPRVLIDGRPARAPWIDLGDLRAQGAIVVWNDLGAPGLPPAYRAIADDAEIQQPFTLPMRLGNGAVHIGWAVLRPRPVVAEGSR